MKKILNKFRHKNSASLMQILLGHLFFYFLVFLLGVVIWLASIVYISSTTSSSSIVNDIEKALPSLQREQFSSSALKVFLDHGDHYQVISYSRGVVYNSEDSKEHDLKPDDLVFVPDYLKGTYFTMVGYREKDGSQRFLIEMRMRDIWGDTELQAASDIGSFAFY